VVNGLGADIQSLWLRDDKGRFFKGEALKAGQNVPLALVASIPPSAPVNNLVGLYQASWPTAHDSLTNAPGNYLRPGTYLAVMAETPFIENGLGKPGKSRSRQTVIGLLAPEDVK
jgi:hypothetical protein